MKLVVVESPAKCKTINKYLGSDYNVLASFGHIRDLPSKNGSVDTENNFGMNYEISPDSTKHVKALVDAAKKSDTVVLATDPDREGEAISWHVLEVLRQKKAIKKDTKILRVAFNSITKAAVNEAINNPRELDMDLIDAQQARRALDYLVGFNLSPVLWRKLPGSRSAGRVQSVALRIVCEREAEIERFKSDEYWTIEGEFKNPADQAFTARLTHFDRNKLDKLDIKDSASANSIITACKAADYKVTEVELKQSKRKPYPPFTTSTLQQDASSKLGFSAKQTMMVAQKLYEGKDLGGETTGIITYMRTDAVNLAPEAISGARDYISKNIGDNYLPAKGISYSSKAKNAQEAHEAIRPTNPSRTPDSIKNKLNDDEYKLYTLIWKRTIASQMQSAVFDKVGANLANNDNSIIFRATGSTLKFDGFLRVYNYNISTDDEDSILPPLAKNDATALSDDNPTGKQSFTQPPPRYSEAALVKKMEELGIGRPSTYAATLSVLQDREYVILDKKRFIPESRGRIVTAFLEQFFPRYVEYDFTAKMEDELDEVSAGKVNWKDAMQNFWGDFKASCEGAMELKNQDVIEEIDERLSILLYGEKQKRDCPKCGSKISLRTGKFGAFIGCTNHPDCNYTKQLGASNDNDGESEDKTLGEIDGKNLYLKKGPYGHYIQLGDGKAKEAKRQGVPKNVKPADVDFALAEKLIALPRKLGEHPETGKEILANIGRYGPYLQHDGKFVSLKEDDVLEVGINRAVALIAEEANKPKGKGRGAAAEPIRNVGKHTNGDDINIFDGKYGPYIKFKNGKKNVNVSLPKGTEAEKITLDEAIALIDKKIG